ncbi:hypothetical protein ACQ4PT_022617 [Festuca glaucescens]
MSLVARLFDTLSLDAWKNPFSSIFGTAAGADAWLASDTTAFAETYIESRETAEAYVFSARLPAGVSKEEVRVDVEEGHVLVIAGERSVRREARSDEARHVIERSCASFFGRFCLPDDAAVGQVRAAMDDGGELVVTVPRIGAAVVALPEPALAIEVEASPC